MANATDWLETKAIQHVLGIAAMPMPPLLYAGLCTNATTPTDTTPGTEVSGGAYTRMPVIFAMVAGGIAGEAANTQTLQWAIATAKWGDLQWVELWDQPSGGDRFFYLPLVSPDDGMTPIIVTVNDGDIMRIPAGLLIVTAD